MWYTTQHYVQLSVDTYLTVVVNRQDAVKSHDYDVPDSPADAEIVSVTLCNDKHSIDISPCIEEIGQLLTGDKLLTFLTESE